MTYQQALDYLYERLPVFHISGGDAYKPGLDNTIRLLNALGNPEKKFRSIHIAGTNGKGSVSHFLAAVFQQAGYRTGLYTSPHLVEFGERIRIDGSMIEQSYVVEFVSTHKQLIEDVQPSFFELTMAMAFTYFAQQEIEMAIIETGLGGRLDSTNIILPELSVITNIGLDHTEFLGDTLQKIAVEKAGIIKQGVPVVVGEVVNETGEVFHSRARELSSKLIIASESYPVHLKAIEKGKLSFIYDNKVLHSGLTGMYQLKNLSTVLASIDQLRLQGYELSENAVAEGLSEVSRITGLRGRWEELKEAPLLIADTGHNVQGFTAIAQQLELYADRPIRILIGMVNDKDIAGVLALLPTRARYYFTNAQVKRALPATELQGLASAYGLKGESFNTVAEALTTVQAEASVDDLILITGSNFIVGEALSLI